MEQERRMPLMEENIINNPFIDCTARDMEFAEVKEYWCSPFTLYKLDETELFESKTPIVLEGVRGTGKTMILKYLSFSVQKKFVEEKTIEERLKYFSQRSFGVYFRYKVDFCNLFNQMNCSQSEKERIFKRYFELFIVREIINNVRDLYDGKASSEMSNAISNALDISQSDINNYTFAIDDMINEMDKIINSAYYDVNWKNSIFPLLGSGNLIQSLVKSITSTVPGWDKILFNILLDEYENLGILQKTVNTMIKQKDDTINLTYRLGVRPAGMEINNDTYVGKEKLQTSRDFKTCYLVFKKVKDYKDFAYEVARKRLCKIEAYYKNGLTDIEKLLGKQEDFDEEAASIAKGDKQFQRISKLLPVSEFEEAKKLLSNDEKLLEMYNILLVSRGMDYRKVSDISQRYIECRKHRELKRAFGDVHKYDLDYGDKYRLALLFSLLTIYKKKKLYYSFNTFIYLSSGSIDGFISLCRNTFKLIDYPMFDELIAGKKIPARIQTYGAIDTAEDQRRKIYQSNNFGSEMCSFIDNIGSIFEEYHRDLDVKYPETNQFAFDNESLIYNDLFLKPFLVELINSGAVIKKKYRQRKSLNQPKGQLYQLNRIFAPIFQFSYRTRGGFNQIISVDLFKEMLQRSINPREYIGNVAESGNENFGQIDYFDIIDKG